MKQLFIIVVVVFSSFSLSAQKIHFTDTTNVWSELSLGYNGIFSPALRYSTYYFISDTAIGSYEYRNFSFGLIREDTNFNKVYIRDVIGDSDMVLMDYNLKVGDSFTTNKFVVYAIDSTLINSVWHRVWYFMGSTHGTFNYSGLIDVIYGIGCLQDPTYMLRDFSGCIECEEPYMYCFSNKGIAPPISPAVDFFDNATSCSIYPALLNASKLQISDNNTTLYPNPTSTSLIISTRYKIKSITIYNIIGQTVYSEQNNATQVQIDVSTLSAGMYLVRINGIEVSKFVKD